jgi:hypothetical protein
MAVEQIMCPVFSVPFSIILFAMYSYDLGGEQISKFRSHIEIIDVAYTYIYSTKVEVRRLWWP